MKMMDEKLTDDIKKELFSQIKFMTSKLKKEKRLLMKESLVVEYDNGGGQKGTKKNPRFDAFNALMGTYLKTVRQYNAMFTEEQIEEDETFEDMIKTFKVAQ